MKGKEKNRKKKRDLPHPKKKRDLQPRQERWRRQEVAMTRGG